MEENRIIETTDLPGDSWQYSLRPHYLREYIGQDKVKDNLEVFIKAAKLRKEALDHVLLYGPPGLGKTTMAGIIANELGVNLRITSGPAIERPGDLAALLTNLQERDLLFIDEIHRLSHSVEEVLYAAMEDYALDIVIGKGPSARSVRIDLPQAGLSPSLAADPVWQDDLLFTHDGISGPASLKASLFWRPGQEVALDFLPGSDLAALLDDYVVAAANGTVTMRMRRL